VAGFVPAVLNRAIIDEVIPVSDDAAFAAARDLAREEGILAGISSGAALSAALAVSARPDAAGKVVVVMLPDTGERYVTTPLFSQMVGDVAAGAGAAPEGAPARSGPNAADR
jgi:cysteine synthase A